VSTHARQIDWYGTGCVDGEPEREADEGPSPGDPEEHGPLTGCRCGVPHDTAFVVAFLPVAIVSFVMLVVGLLLAGTLLATVIGVPIAVGTLAAASGFATVQRRLLAVRGTPLPPGRRPVPRGRGPLAILPCAILVVWWFAALTGVDPVRAFEAVGTETPATRATSASTGGRRTGWSIRWWSVASRRPSSSGSRRGTAIGGLGSRLRHSPSRA
jgi:Putative sensor